MQQLRNKFVKAKVVHVVPSIADEASGPSYSVVSLCNSLIFEGGNVELAALEWLPVDKYPEYAHIFKLGIGPRMLGLSPGMYRWLKEQTRNDRINIVHNHGTWIMPGVYSGWATKNSNCRLIYSPRGSLSKWALGHSAFQKKIFWALLQEPALRHASCIHATAESEYEEIRSVGFQQPVCIIPNGIDIPKEIKRNKRTRRKLLFIGRIHPVKGVDILLNAWSKVFERYPNWDLYIVGPDNGGYLQKMKDLSKVLKLENVKFTGPVFGEEKQALYQESDLFVLPTHSENFGMTVAESLANRTPAIVSEGAPWSGLERENAGWWIEIGVEPLVKCLESALPLSRIELEVMGERGRSWMVRDFGWESIARSMLAVYMWVLGHGKKPDCVHVK